MSRAFVKENDEQLSSDELPERPLSALPNYVTPRGLEQLHARRQELQHEHAQLAVEDDALARQRKLEIERDLRYYNAQIERATMVDPGQPHDEARFGATVGIRDEDGVEYIFHIVGDDEADLAAGSISWASPLGTALIGARVGDRVAWRRPAGATEIEVLAVRYPSQDAAADGMPRRT